MQCKATSVWSDRTKARVRNTHFLMIKVDSFSKHLGGFEDKRALEIAEMLKDHQFTRRSEEFTSNSLDVQVIEPLDKACGEPFLEKKFKNVEEEGLFTIYKRAENGADPQQGTNFSFKRFLEEDKDLRIDCNIFSSSVHFQNYTGNLRGKDAFTFLQWMPDNFEFKYHGKRVYRKYINGVAGDYYPISLFFSFIYFCQSTLKDVSTNP